MYKKIFYPITIFFLFLAFTGANFAQNQGEKDMRGFNKLNLTDEQKNQIKELTFAQQEVMITLTAELKKEQLELKKLLSDDNSSVESLIEAHNRMKDISSKIGEHRLNSWLAVYKILDPEQQKMWKKTFPGNGHRAKGMRENRKTRNKH